MKSEDFYGALAEIVAKSGMNQLKFAEAVGITRTYMSQIMLGRALPPSEAVLRQIAKVGGLSSEEELKLLVMAEKYKASPSIKKVLDAGLKKLESEGNAQPVEIKPDQLGKLFVTQEELDNMLDEKMKQAEQQKKKEGGGRSGA